MARTFHSAAIPVLVLAVVAAGCRTAAGPPPPPAPLAETAKPTPPAPAPSGDPVLAAAADPDAPGHDEAIERWEDTPWEEQCDRLRAALRSPDARAALFAARTLWFENLSLEEIRLQAAILVRHPEVVFSKAGGAECYACDGAYSLGSPDVIPLLEAVIARGGIPAAEHSLDDLHRMTVQDHIPDLVRLLEPARDEVYRRILWMLVLLADNTDRHRDHVAAGLLYARAAHVAELKGRAPPALADFPPFHGTSKEFLARFHALLDGTDPAENAERFPWNWWERWQAEDTAAPSETRVEAYTAAEARSRAASLAAKPAPVWMTWKDDWEAVCEDLARIEVAAPEALDDLLRRWSESLAGREDSEFERLRALRARAPDRIAEAEAALGQVETALREGEEVQSLPAAMGRLGDRARPLLEKYRRERHHGFYWQATAALAVAGDAGARAEILGLIRDDRVSAFDTLRDPVALTLDGDPEALEHWISRVGANCCLWYHAWDRLHRWLPTLAAENTVGDSEGRERQARAWWEKWKGRLRWSRLADGWVPAAD